MPPASLSALIDLAVFDGDMMVKGARICRPPSGRRAKGTDLTRLTPQDWELLRETLGSPASGEPERGGSPAAAVHPPAHRTGIEIEVVPTDFSVT